MYTTCHATNQSDFCQVCPQYYEMSQIYVQLRNTNVLQLQSQIVIGTVTVTLFAKQGNRDRF